VRVSGFGREYAGSKISEVLIPPLGGVIMADFFIRERGRYPVIGEAVVPPVQPAGARSLRRPHGPGHPVNGIAVAFLVLLRLT